MDVYPKEIAQLCVLVSMCACVCVYAYTQQQQHQIYANDVKPLAWKLYKETSALAEKNYWNAQHLKIDKTN